jgi:hypothetical protein
MILALPLSPAGAGDPRYEDITVTDDKDSAVARESFTPDTPKIFVVCRLADVPAGTRLKSVWIAEKTDVAPPNYEIDSYELTGGGDMNRISFSFSRPDAGWPAGDYRVDLYIDGNPVDSARFRVKP